MVLTKRYVDSTLQKGYTLFQCRLGGSSVRTGFKDAKGLTIIDAVITLCLIGILIGVVIPQYHRVAREAREVALKMGLTNIRTSIRLFRMLNERNPRSLRELIENDLLLPARRGKDPFAGAIFLDEKYLEKQAQDAEGHLVDAFGNRYAYDPVRGEVKASTKGYENW
jgi:competence protein ComGC